MFALGLMSWLYTRPTEGTIDFIEKKFAKRPEIAEANTRAFKAGYAFGETSEDFAVHYEVAPAPLPPGRTATSPGTRRSRWASSRRACRRSCRSSSARIRSRRPRASSRSSRATRTSASGHSRPRTRSRPRAPLSARRFGGALGVCTSSGPGVVLKPETIGLAVTLELPLAHRRRPARGPVDRDADEARAGRPARRCCSGGTPSRRCRWSRPRRRAAASTRRSRPRGSRSSTGRPSSCSPTRTSRTAPSRG